VEPAGILTAEASLSARTYAQADLAPRFLQPPLEHVRALPQVRTAAWTSALPMRQWGTNGDFFIAGDPPPQPGEAPVAQFVSVSSQYFSTMGIRLLSGRDFADREAADSPATVVINREMADRYFAGRDPIGRQIGTPNLATIIGVVEDVRQAGVHAPIDPQVYRPYAQSPANVVTLVIKAQDAQGVSAADLRSAVRAVAPSQPLANIVPMAYVLSESTADRRLYMVLLVAFAFIAVVLALSGVYGIMLHSVAARTRELGIRTALGATPLSIRRLVLKQALWLAGAGLVIGSAGAVAAATVLQSIVFGVTPSDPLTVAGVCLLMLLSSLLASYLPAARAARLSVTSALRYE
jgi:predicted permease